MSIRRRHLAPPLLCLLVLSASPPLGAQTTPPTTIPTGTTRTTENSRAVSGVRIQPMPDGTVWFLIPFNDRIVQLQADGVTFKQWQIRPDNQLGANPVDFQIDGNLVWFIENGQSQIDAGRSALGRLDTTNGQLREWVVPGSKPAGFWRAPDGNTVWIPQTNGRLQSLDLTTLQVVDYRSASADGKTFTFAYSDVVLGPDGALWLTDFGNNRIVRYVPGAATETSWTFYDPNLSRLNPSQIRFDEAGMLWISMLTGSSVDRFDPATSELTFFGGFTRPVHFDIFDGRVYVSEATGGNGIVTALDPRIAGRSTVTLTPQTLDTKSVVNKLAATIRDSTITPTNYTTTVASIPDSNLTVTSIGPGLLATAFSSTNAYGISAEGGGIWVGSNGFLVRLTLQNIGAAADLTVPVAVESGVSPRIVIDINLFNRGSAPISGDALLLASPGSLAARVAFTVDPGATVLLADAFKDAATGNGLTMGPVRLRVTSGTATDLVASVRSARQLADGSSFGFQIPALAGAQALSTGSSQTLFTDGRDGTVSVLGFYAPAAASATATLVAPDGTVRGTRLVALDTNVAEEFNPAASAFGVSPEAGDVVRVTVDSGSLEAYVSVLDTGTGDVAISLPVAATREAILPNVGTLDRGDGTRFVSDLIVSNPDPSNPANVLVSFSPVGSTASPQLASLTLPPNATQTIEDVLPTLFSVTAGQGALGVSSDVAIAIWARVAARTTAGDYGTFATAFDIGEGLPGGGATFAFGVRQTATRRTHLLLYNHGEAGNVTVIGRDGTGKELGRLSISIGAHQAARVNSVFAQFGIFDQAAGSIRIETEPGMQIFAETAQVDVSGDLEIAKLIPAS